jgi:hypothetical protein
MTVIVAMPSDGTRTLRVAGILFLIAGAATPVEVALLRYSLSIKVPPGMYVYSPSLVWAVAAVAAAAVVGGCVIVCGFAMISGARAGARLIHDGLLAR